jgi:hypothetical protein
MRGAVGPAAASGPTYGSLLADGFDAYCRRSAAPFELPATMNADFQASAAAAASASFLESQLQQQQPLGVGALGGGGFASAVYPSLFQSSSYFGIPSR